MFIFTVSQRYKTMYHKIYCTMHLIGLVKNPSLPPSEGQLGHLCLNCHCLRTTRLCSLLVSPFSQLIPAGLLSLVKSDNDFQFHYILAQILDRFFIYI